MLFENIACGSVFEISAGRFYLKTESGVIDVISGRSEVFEAGDKVITVIPIATFFAIHHALLAQEVLRERVKDIPIHPAHPSVRS